MDAAGSYAAPMDTFAGFRCRISAAGFVRWGDAFPDANPA